NLNKLAVIKLNGGLGTSMGLKKAKSLLPVKDGLSFLDIIAKQILNIRQKSDVQIPLILMNSFNTSYDSLNELSKYDNLKINDIPLDFLQNKFPKILQKDLTFLDDQDKKLNWNPPGHGDIYITLAQTKLIETLLDKGYEYLFISNSDNLGAIIDNKILNYFAKENLPFMMEVCSRTEADKKGGHLAQTKEGQLLLRETAQCPKNEISEFEDVNIYKYFNTNNLWVNLKGLKYKLEINNNMMLLPLIMNKKIVNDKHIYQIESAMGSAISSFKRSQALIVPRSRFAPVKKTNDLLAIWSDAYNLDESYQIKLSDKCKRPPIVELDPKYYKNIDQMKNRFKKGIPSLVNAKKITVRGDVSFGENVIIEDEVIIQSKKPIFIKDKTFNKTIID
ncbi:MAG: UTP--glucose-1-phosphate uridylyltransferase, partial [Candidatus Cloacimonadota bacterium]|nr:UTP--glucose-1-phosphate uridylyltransferase [Candidatus Cloacimonadota bacterium]